MDFSQKRWTFVTFRLYYPLCVSRRVDTWHIVYLSYKDPVLKYQFIKVRLRCINVTRAAWTAMELARIHSQLQGNSARPSHFLDAETCEFPSLQTVKSRLSEKVHRFWKVHRLDPSVAVLNARGVHVGLNDGSMKPSSDLEIHFFVIAQLYVHHNRAAAV